LPTALSAGQDRRGPHGQLCASPIGRRPGWRFVLKPDTLQRRRSAACGWRPGVSGMERLKVLLGALLRLVFHNLLTKLLCLLMAFLLYLYVNTSENIDRDFTLPLSIANRPAQMLVTSQSASDVHVVVYGPRAKMDQLKASDLMVTLSLRDSQGSGEVVFPVYTDQVETPPGIRVRSIEPASVTLKLEAIVPRTVEIHAGIDGVPKEGYEVASVQVSPPRIEVAGPPSVLSAMQTLETESVDIAGMTGSFKQRVGFRTPNLVSLPVQRSAIVAVTIREKTLQRILENVPVGSLSGRTDLVFEPKSVSVELLGPYSIVQSLTSDLVEPVVSDDGLRPGVPAKRPVTLRAVPAQKIDVVIEPKEVIVTAPTPSPEPAAPPAAESPASKTPLPRPGRSGQEGKPAEGSGTPGP
jgi:YbbR domain-containing protein